MKNIAMSIAALLFALNCFSETQEDAVKQAVNRYLTALKELNYEDFVASILPQARCEEDASKEGMFFWHDEIQEEYGFDGEIEIIFLPPVNNEASIPEAFALFKNEDSERSVSDGFHLMFQDQEWWIVHPGQYSPLNNACTFSH